ncbi:MAG: hypothetical protein HOK58_16265, partial [Acidimicrobiaceae bacterium]|nr:hypothetical protein [Acidimicrobiaceae bacterium]
MIDLWHTVGIQAVVDTRAECSDEDLVTEVAPNIAYLNAGVIDGGQPMRDSWFEIIHRCADENDGGSSLFNWTTFPKVTLEELARERDLRVTYAAEDLEGEFGSPPGDDFVKELWPTLREEWLGRSPEPPLNVVKALRAKGLGDAEARISTKAGQMDHLRSCRMSANLRTIVHNEFLRAGQRAPDENPPDVATTESSVTSSQPLDDPTQQNIQPTGDTADRSIPAAPAPGPAPSHPSTEPDGEHGFFGRLWDKVTGGGNDGEPRPITEPDTPIAQHPAAVTTKPDRKGPSSQPAAPLTSPDAGLRAVEMLFEQMMIDEEWATRRPRGFTWWAYRLAQHIEAGEPYEVAPGVF